jgi:hypothetical protein
VSRGRLQPALLAVAALFGDWPAADPPATWAMVTTLAARNPRTGRPVHSSEELLPLLPRELRSNFTFVHDSRGPLGRGAHPDNPSMSWESPRILLFRDDARLVLALNGDPVRPGHDVIEALAFDDATASFHLHQLALPAADERDSHSSSPSPSNGFRESPQCVACHGVDPRPLFDAYPLWPGFYGSVLDTLSANPAERARYREFLGPGGNSRRGLYRHLLWPKGSRDTPYSDGPPPAIPPPPGEDSVDAVAAALRFAPNARLGMALTELNRKRIQRRLRASPKYPVYRYALVSGLLGCESLPLSRARRLRARAAIAAERGEVVGRLGADPGPVDAFKDSFGDAVAQIDYLADALGVSREGWSMALDSRSLDFFDGILSGLADRRSFYLKEDFLHEMLLDLAADDAALRPFVRSYSAFGRVGFPFGRRLDLERARTACPLLRDRVANSGVELPPDN